MGCQWDRLFRVRRFCQLVNILWKLRHGSWRILYLEWPVEAVLRSVFFGINFGIGWNGKLLDSELNIMAQNKRWTGRYVFHLRAGYPPRWTASLLPWAIGNVLSPFGAVVCKCVLVGLERSSRVFVVILRLGNSRCRHLISLWRRRGGYIYWEVMTRMLEEYGLNAVLGYAISLNSNSKPITDNKNSVVGSRNK